MLTKASIIGQGEAEAVICGEIYNINCIYRYESRSIRSADLNQPSSQREDYHLGPPL